MLIGAETEPPYPLSKGYLTGVPGRAEWWAEHDIEWRPGTAAVGLNLQPEALRPTDTIGSTGSRSHVPGADLDGRYLRTRRTHCGRVRRAERVVGLETAAAAGSGDGVAAAAAPLAAEEVATVFRDLHLGHGIDFRFGTASGSSGAPVMPCGR